MGWRDAWNWFTQIFSVVMPNETNRNLSIINYVNEL
jgi:hypothetical protein